MELRCEGGETVNKTHKESRIKVAITALQKANQRVKARGGEGESQEEAACGAPEERTCTRI